MRKLRKDTKVSAVVVVVLAVLLFVILSEKLHKCPENHSNKTIKYWPYVKRMWNPNDNLRTVKRVLDRLGHEMVNGSDEWDVW